ncbi:hypothetical protein HSBAA_46210 [Vreelandella sulfidaeris]|uniref:D-isomer specific 2-hydroxyacid dehydrogenase catalytic domain-containing protein n=1 Tax=Vreelandella sulfidaeris TaxID=115553 RepID=A0A455UBA3_9GAMM|nr:hypothetical protein HSBAA_46210 [Halomonas sulfidaeris]
MKIAIPDDYQDCVRSLDAFNQLEGHDVTIYHDTLTDLNALSAFSGRRGVSADSGTHPDHRRAVGALTQPESH